MTNTPVITFNRAADLPAEWDASAGPGFMSRSLLGLLERINPCNQHYHVATTTAAASIAVTYHHRLNLFSFARGSAALRIPVRIVGIPCSVAAPGLASGSSESTSLLLEHLAAQPGLTIALNTPSQTLGHEFISSTTLPTFRLRIAWPDFTSYLASMRSTYRRRIQLALSRGANLQAEVLDNPKHFDDSLHSLYLNVFRRSNYPLECLSADFFRTFPGVITIFRDGIHPAGFVKTLQQADRLIFLFGGLDYSRLESHDTYLNMLLHIVRTGIESGCREIDLGQTAGTSKLRLGAEMVPLYLLASHPSPLARWLLRRTRNLLSYSIPKEAPRVFRH